eukprot:TRINITY_DN3092_c0_g1_i1.p1 TRINITY_DN3092_c0_g1~~TRINITY_DN3092_c0_g1_i1.p1  ORF type:complete len:237 (-),score=29.42 TRINITY_DN3092_c0_g1_i1:83-793(-)
MLRLRCPPPSRNFNSSPLSVQNRPSFLFQNFQNGRNLSSQASRLYTPKYFQATPFSFSSLRRFFGTSRPVLAETPAASSSLFAETIEQEKETEVYKEKQNWVRLSRTHWRTSPRKLNELCRLIRGLNYKEAVSQLKFSRRRFARPIISLLKQAKNEGETRFGFDADRLVVGECYVTRGKIHKGVNFHARSKLGIVHHHHSHFTVVLHEVPREEGEIKLGRFGKRNDFWKDQPLPEW